MIYDLIILAVYMALIMLAGLMFSKNVKNTSDYFLAARSIPWFWIMGSVWATNIGFLHGYLAHGGASYEWGLVQANFEWFQGPVGYILSGVIFISFYWRVGIFTVSEFLERRYGPHIRLIYTLAWLFIFLVTVAAELYLGGLFLKHILNIPFWPTVLVLTAVVGTYTFLGGLGAAVMVEFLQFIIMMLGTMPLLFIVLNKVGGFAGIKEVLLNQWHVSPEYLTVMPGLLHPYGPGAWIILGLCLVTTIGWCSGHQSMVQRNLGARTNYDAKFGYVMGSIPKTMGAFLYMVPMIAAPIIFAQNGIFVEKADAAYGKLILSLLPVGMLGVFLAGLVSAGLSSIGSVLNSGSTMIVKDIYERFLVKGKPDSHYFFVGRIATIGLIIASLLLVPIVTKVALIMWLEQTLLAMTLGPFMGILILGIFWRRINNAGGLAGFLGGGIFAVVLNQVIGVKVVFMISWWSFVVSTVLAIAVSLLTKKPPAEKVDGLTWESDFKSNVGVVTGQRAENNGIKVTSVPLRKKVPVYLSIRLWATIILVTQIVLLMFFG
jgi:SSS family solute:Na+ symporter